MKVIALGAQKGGVAKTTSSLYLATRLAEMLGGTAAEPAVGLIDRDDSSRNLTRLLATFPQLVRPGVVMLLGEDLPPAHAAPPVVIVDTPPGLNAISSLREADLIVVPVLPELQGIINLTDYLDSIEEQRLTISPGMRLLALLPTRVQARSVSDRQRLADIRAIAANQAPPLLILPAVPHREAIKRYDLDTLEYNAPAEEIVRHAKIARPTTTS